MTAASFVKVDQSQRARPTIRMLNVPLVMRHDTDEATNNRKSTTLFGHPRLFKLPSRIDAKDIWALVRKVVSEDGTYTLHLVDGQVSSNILYLCIFFFLRKITLRIVEIDITDD